MTELVACTNAGDTLRRLALFSDAVIRLSYPTGVTPGVAQVLSQEPLPVPEAQRSALLAVENVTSLTDGRVSAVVTIDDPTTHYHPQPKPHPPPAPPTTPEPPSPPSSSPNKTAAG